MCRSTRSGLSNEPSRCRRTVSPAKPTQISQTGENKHNCSVCEEELKVISAWTFVVFTSSSSCAPPGCVWPQHTCICECVREEVFPPWSRGKGNYLGDNERWLIAVGGGGANLIVQGDFGQKMKAVFANWRLFAMGFLEQRGAPERLLRIKSSNSSRFIYPCVGRGEKNMFTLSAACAIDDTLCATNIYIYFFFKPSKQNIHCRREQSLIVNNWCNTVLSEVEASQCLSKRSWLHLLTLVSQPPAASPSHRSGGRPNQNNDALWA